MRSVICGFCVLALACFSAVRPALAGGGPEDVLLVVNSNSDSSKTIANAYIELRKIPANHVLYLDWKGGLEMTSGESFRDKILKPVINALDERHLTLLVDYVVYSSDFPWRVDLKPIFPNDQFTSPFEPVASTTGATYLLSFIIGKQPQPGLVMPGVNWYVPGATTANQLQCTQLANVPS